MAWSLYLHVPFCVRRCRYCDFVSLPLSGDLRERYLAVLLRELESADPQPLEGALTTVHLGGGTPSLLTPAQVGMLLGTVARRFPLAPDAEIALEANPGTVTAGTLRGYRDAGVNRLTLGVQSLDDDLLRFLGRIHTRREAVDAFRWARRAGFGSVGVDLIHSVPGMGVERWRSILREALSLGPDHLSAYALTPEEGTPLFDDLARGRGTLPDDDDSARMFEVTDELCSRGGLVRYEISNHALPGFESRHNRGYWERGWYLGCGLAAHSFLPLSPWGSRFSRTRDLGRYLEEGTKGVFTAEGLHHLCREEAEEETMFLGLRLAQGVSRQGFARRFGRDPVARFPVIGRLEAQGLLVVDGERIRIPPELVYRSNAILSRFV